MPGGSPHERGFTVLALLVVLVSLSLVAATSVRWYFSRDEVTLENAAVLLARDLRAAQHRSIFLGRPGRLRRRPLFEHAPDLLAGDLGFVEQVRQFRFGFGLVRHWKFQGEIVD